MALGVLNNLSAIYAENNLNNTNASLQTVLQQLSSGSKINSGADDAAGLSLVNGLQANSTALTQSETNATEGVGLLDVADGALSQVTSLLNRAITLATEASNGTLNSTQEAAANQEYQSILAEVNNIGSTTTYNQQQVFTGNTVAIYSGDSSMAGSSIDDLNIRTLSSSSMGDTDGVMSYNSGQDNVFINLSNGGDNAALSDSLNAGGATTIDVDYMTKGANGTATAATAEISVGSGTSYANTAQGMITAINNAGLGLTASFGTAAEAGTSASATASAANNGGGSESDTGIIISAAGIGSGSNDAGVVGALALASGDTLGGTLSIVSADGTSHNIELGTANSTDTLANLEATINAAGYGVTAALNQAGTQLTFTTAEPNVTVAASNLSENSTSSSATTTIQASGLGSLTVGSAADTLKGTLEITEGADGLNTESTLVLGTQGSTDTLANLATTIANGGYGITATLNQAGTALVFSKTGSDLGSAAISGSSVTDVAAPLIADGGTLGSLSVASAGDTLASGSLNITSGISGAAATPLTLGTLGETDTLSNLAATINSGDYGITATLDPTGTELTFVQTSGTHTAAIGGTAVDTTYTTTPDAISTGTTLGSITVAGSSDTLSVATSGDGLSLAGDTHTNTIDLGTSLVSLTTLKSEVNADTASDGITATLNSAGTTLTFTEAPGTTGASVSVTSGQTLTDNISAVVHTSASTFTQGATLGSLSATFENDTLSGTLDITEGADSSETATSLNISNQTLAQIADTINHGGYGITATLNQAGNGVAADTLLTFTQSSGDAGTATITNDGVIADTAVAVSNPALSVLPGSGLGSLTAVSANDMLSGTLEVTNTAGVSSAFTFTGQTLQQIEDSFNMPPDGQNDTSGVTAALVGNVLTFTGSGSNAVSGVGITDFTPASTTNQVVNTGTILNTLTVENSADLVTGAFKTTSGANDAVVASNALSTGQTLQQIAADFNSTTGIDSAKFDALGITAVLGNNDTTLTFEQNEGDTYTANITDVSLADTTSASSSTANIFSAAHNLANTLTVNATSDTLTGTLAIQEGADLDHTASTYNLEGQTLAEVAAAFNTGAEKNLGITAILNGAGTTLTFVQTPGDAGTADVTDATKLVDQTASVGNPISVTTGTMLDTLTVNGSGDKLGGTLNLTSGITGVVHALPLGTTGTTDTLANLMTTINNAGYGITATLNAAKTQLTFTQNNGDGFTAAMSGTAITDSEATGVGTSSELGSLTVNSASDTLSGTLTGMEPNGITPYTITLGTPGATDTLQNLEHTIDVTDAQYGITATLNQAGTSLAFSASAGDTGTPTLGNEGSITDTTPAAETAISLTETPSSGTQETANLGSLSILGTDTLSGSLTIGNKTLDIGSTDNTAATLMAAINKGDYGATASYNPANDQMTFSSANSSMGINTSNLYETVQNGSSAIRVGSLSGGGSTSSGYYSIGISGTVTDTSTAVTVGGTTTYGGTTNVGITSDSNGAGGTATMSYTDAAGQSLSGTDLLNQTDAQSALNSLNVAITDIAAQDGYIGAQINTLNAISQVMSTQQENVVSAQNAIQATDYASATSNMSKYEILSQTGIAALAQANSVQQEVTKLLQ